MRDIKDYLDKELNKFVLANIIVVLLLSGQLDVLTDAKTITAFGISLANISIIASPMYIYVYVVNYMYTSDAKDRIVFLWKTQPGCTVFSRIKKGKIDDSRFTKEDVVKQYSEIYQAIDNCDGDKGKLRSVENSSWYKKYRIHKDEGAVKDALRGQLLCRDICVISFNMFILLILLYIIGYGYLFNGLCFLFLFFVYIASNAAARYRAERLVLNVIAIDVNSEKK